MLSTSNLLPSPEDKCSQPSDVEITNGDLTFGTREGFQRINRTLVAARSLDDVEGLHFHGTVEQFDGPLRPSSYDGLCWFANHSTIAQTYIPACGLEAILGWRSFEADRHVRPGKYCNWYTVVVKAMGYQAVDIEFDNSGDAKSWRLPAGYPTYREALAFLEGRGYQLTRHDTIRLKTSIKNGEETLLPADYRAQGRLFIADLSGLRIFDFATRREGDLTDLDFNKLDLFQRLERDGWDGVKINDFAQSGTWGNVGHISVGVFGKALSDIPYLTIPAVNFDWPGNIDGLAAKATNEFARYFDSVRRVLVV